MAALKQGVPITVNQSSLATGSNRLKSDLEFTGLYQSKTILSVVHCKKKYVRKTVV